MPAYRLHYFPESGNSYKLALMLALCGQRFEPVWTDFGGGVTRTAEWRARVNPMGEIPVLEEDGRAWTQTGPILLRLAERYGLYGGEGEAERFAVLRWLFWDNGSLSAPMATHRFLRVFTPGPDPAVLAFLRRRLVNSLGILEGQVSQHGFVCGERATVADLSLTGYLVWPAEETGFDLAREYPGVAAWLGRVAALPGWRAPGELLPGPALPRYG